MREDALQYHVDTPRPLDRLAAELRLFAAILLGRIRPAGDHRERALEWAARTEATRLIETGRAAAGSERILSFKLLYAAAKAAASAVPLKPVAPETTPPRWERALGALITLRHRQRAALALYHVLGMSHREVAEVLAIREPEAQKVVESGVGALLRAVGEPLDVRRALRVAGARVLEPRVIRLPEAAPRAQALPPARMPRAVTRTLLAAPQARATTEARPASAVEALLAKVEAIEPDLKDIAVAEAPAPAPAPAPIPVMAERPRGRDRREFAIVIAASVVALAVLLPATHRAADRTSTVASGPVVARAAQPTPMIQAERVRAPAPPVFTVRAGDSLWSIAERRLGDPLRWREIWRLNRGRVMADGTRFTDPGLIRPRWRLKVPGRE